MRATVGVEAQPGAVRGRAPGPGDPVSLDRGALRSVAEQLAIITGFGAPPRRPLATGEFGSCPQYSPPRGAFETVSRPFKPC
jgi:hypothetical protein